MLTYVKAHLGLKGPLPDDSVTYSKIYENGETVYFLKCKHFGNTFIDIVAFPVNMDITGNEIITISIGIPE